MVAVRHLDGRHDVADGRSAPAMSVPEPVTKNSLVADLEALGVERGDVLLVHSSLRALGFVVGGAQAVVDALLAVVGRRGTIVVPTHSDPWSEPSHWEAAIPDDWLATIRDSMPPFHPRITPTAHMGAVVECMRRYPGFRRSWHPRVSFGGIGEHIDELLAEHALTSGFGDESPVARLYETEARILLLGTGHTSSSALHLAEHRAVWPTKRWITQGASMMVDGKATWVSWRELDNDASDFDEIGAAITQSGIERTAEIGRATARLMPVRAAIDIAIEWIEQNRSPSIPTELTPHPATPSRSGSAPTTPLVVANGDR